MSEIGIQIGSQIRDLRRRRGWTQKQLAGALGTDVVTVSRWERATTVPRSRARLQLRWLGLAAGPNGSVSFVDDPQIRIRELDRIQAEQRAFKRRAQR
jgi:transcriptional regulator with XRE-family HTH domain